MVSDINFLLVGNTRLHWAKYSKNQSKFFHTKKDQKVPENIDLDQLIWASVGKLPNFLLKKDNEIKTKDIQLSNLPDYFGVDRALACIAALKIIENTKKKRFTNCRFWNNIINNKIKFKWIYYWGSTSSRFSNTIKINGTKYKKS